jgi:predicted transcriptional regulator
MNKENPVIRVRDVMRNDVNIVDGMLTVGEALRSMKYPKTGMLIVDKRDPDDEFGVVMFRDVARRIMGRDLSPDRINIYEIMSKPAICVDPEMNVRNCARLFHRFGLSRAPVIENGKIIGVVGYREMVLNGLMSMGVIKDLEG